MSSKDGTYRAFSAPGKHETFPAHEVSEILEQFFVTVSVVMAAQFMLKSYHSYAGTFTQNLKPMQINYHQLLLFNK